MLEERRMIDRLKELMNGPWERIDEPIRQAMSIIAGELDAVHEQIRRMNQSFVEELEAMNRKLGWLNALLISSLVTGIIAIGSRLI